MLRILYSIFFLSAAAFILTWAEEAAASKREVIALKPNAKTGRAFGIEVRADGWGHGAARIDVRVTCHDKNSTPPLAAEPSISGVRQKLLNTTKAADHGCVSYTVETLTSQTRVGMEAPKLSVGVEYQAPPAEDPRFGEPAIFVFNPVHGNWTKVESFKLNAAAPQKIYANLSRASQQIIGGVLSVPEAASFNVAGFNQKSLSVTPQSVNPSDGLLAISPVEPDSRGKARVRLPFLLRPNRGPGPSFSVVNTSDGAAGVLGRGWDLNFSRISVRGPSPLYHSNFETEDYLLDGMELVALDGAGKDVPPLYKGGPILPRVRGLRVFRLRDGSSGLIVRRYGKNSNSYFWEVWNPNNRTTRLYGGRLTFDGKQIEFQANSVLHGKVQFGDAGTQMEVIGVWGLSQEYDNQPARSGASYDYEVGDCVGKWANTANCSHALRLKTITYNSSYVGGLDDTGRIGETRIDFLWDEREEAVRYNSDGRLGFFRASQFWLDKVEVSYRPGEPQLWLASSKFPPEASTEAAPYTLFARHDFVLSSGKDPCLNFDKVLVTVKLTANELYDDKVAQQDPPGGGGNTQEFHFEYDGERSCRTEEQKWVQKEIEHKPHLDSETASGLGFPNRLLDGLGFKLLTSGSVLGESNSEETAASLYVGVGPADGHLNRKAISGGIKAGRNFIKSRTGSTLIDVSGDGIDDIVYRTGAGLRYCKGARKDGEVQFLEKPKDCGLIVGLHDISLSSSSITSFGAEAHFVGGFAGIGYNSGDNNTYVYFTHRDGDGLIDAVVYGKVLYGQGEVEEGGKRFVRFTPKSALTPPLPTLTAAMANVKAERKPPGFTDAVNRMGADLAVVSRSLNGRAPTTKVLDYSQKTIAWTAPLTGSVTLSGKFSLDKVKVVKSPEGDTSYLLAKGLRSFEERQNKAMVFAGYHNDCAIWPERPHCNAAGGPQTSFDFIKVPKAQIELSISRETKDDDGNFQSSVKRCSSRELVRGDTFDISDLVANSACSIREDEKWALEKIKTGDVVYLTYSVHPDFTASLAPDAAVNYVAVAHDGGFKLELDIDDEERDALLRCYWKDQLDDAADGAGCLLEHQTRYSFNLATGLLTSSPNGMVIAPQSVRRLFKGKFTLSSSLTQDYQVTFEIRGAPSAEDASSVEQLPVLFSQDVSDHCKSQTGPRCSVELKPICVAAAADSCALFHSAKAPAFALSAKLSIIHTQAQNLEARNLSSRLSSLVWQSPPRIETEVREEKKNKDKTFKRNGKLIEGSARREIAIYLPMVMGDQDVEYRRVERGIFSAPNPKLNEGSEKPIEIDFVKITRDEFKNVELARRRQYIRLCGFGEEILTFLETHFSADGTPYEQGHLAYWEKRLGRFDLKCHEIAHILNHTKFTDKVKPEFEVQNRLRLNNLLRKLVYEDQISSAETLLERVLNNLQLPLNMMTDSPRLTRRGYRLPVKANPLDCDLLGRISEPVLEPITGAQPDCNYRFLVNFAMIDIAKLLRPDPKDSEKKVPWTKAETAAYKALLADLLKSGNAAFDVQVTATVNGVPLAFSELTGSATSSKGPSLTPAEENTCIGSYGAFPKIKNDRHRYPTKTDDVFQRIVTNRRSGRAVAFSDDVAHTGIRGVNEKLGEYKSVAEMEAKQDCRNLEGHTGANAKFVGPPHYSIEMKIEESNHFIGRNRVFQFEASPLDVVEFHVQLRPAERTLAATGQGGVAFNLVGKFSAESQLPAKTEYHVIPRSPSQIVPPNLDPTYCGTNENASMLAKTCRPWTRIGWSEFLLGAEYRTYSDVHRARTDKEFSFKRRREILRLHPEIATSADEFRLEWERDLLPTAGEQYVEQRSAETISRAVATEAARTAFERVRAPMEKRDVFIPRMTTRLMNLLKDRSGTVNVAFAHSRNPAAYKIGDGWTLFAQKAQADGNLRLPDTFVQVRYGKSIATKDQTKPAKRYEDAKQACESTGADQFSKCKSDLEADGKNTLALRDISVFPLAHRFVGPVHETAVNNAVTPLMAGTDTCTVSLPESFASCWKGQDDTIYLYREIQPEENNPQEVRSVAALVGFELPEIEQYLFGLDAFARVACNDANALKAECKEMLDAPSPPASDAQSFAETHLLPATANHVTAGVNGGNPVAAAGERNILLRGSPPAPNRPNPPHEDTTLHVFGPILNSSTKAISANVGAGFGGLSFNTSKVSNRHTTKTFYLDVNGDGFPEVVSGGTARLTSPVGLLREDWWRYFKAPGAGNALTQGRSARSYLQSSKSKSMGAGFGLSPSSFAKIKQKTVDATVSPGFDLSFENGYQTAFEDLRDFNGDGLVDAINGGAITSGLTVAYSTGNALRTNARETIGVSGASLSGYAFQNHYNTTQSAGFGVRLGFDIDHGSFVGGMGLGSRTRSSEGVLMDFTGDGRVDIVVPVERGGKNFLAVYPNLGNGFRQARFHEIDGWRGSETSASETTLVDSGAAFTFGAQILFVKIVFNPAVKHAKNQTRELVHLRDINADGFPDLVTVSGLFQGANASGVPSLSPGTDVKTNVYYNPGPKYYLLSKITNPARVTQEMDYLLRGNSGPEHGRPAWVVSKVASYDGFDADRHSKKIYPDGQDTKLNVYEYRSGYFNRAERAFYGFADVTRTTFGCNGNTGSGACGQINKLAHAADGIAGLNQYVLLQKRIRNYHNRDHFTKGQMVADVVIGPARTSATAGDPLEVALSSKGPLELVSARRFGYSIDDLKSTAQADTPACKPIPPQTKQARWRHGNYTTGSSLPPMWRAAIPRVTNNGALLGSGAVCRSDVVNCSKILAQTTCERGFWAEQTQFWAQQTGSVRQRFEDLHVYASGTRIKDNPTAAGITVDQTQALYSANGTDQDQWGHPITSYVIGEVKLEAANGPVRKSSLHATTRYVDRQSLNREVKVLDAPDVRPYPIVGLSQVAQIFEGAWAEGSQKLLRVREALYTKDGRANLSDICHYPGGQGFTFRTSSDDKLSICQSFKDGMEKALSDGLSSIQDALRSTYASVVGLPSGNKSFSALLHTQFPEYDRFGNLTHAITPVSKDREWIERHFDYRDDPFRKTATLVAMQRCVHDRKGVGTNSRDVKPDPAKPDCRFGKDQLLTGDPRKAVTHTLHRRMDPHHGKTAATTGPNANALLLDFDRWGRFRLLARSWGSPPRQNQAYRNDLELASGKLANPFEIDDWRILSVANYAFPADERPYLSSHIRHFASSNAYAGASGSFDTTRHSSIFADGLNAVIQRISEAEVCTAAPPELLASKNGFVGKPLQDRCRAVVAGRVEPAPARDALGRQLAIFEGYATDANQGSAAPAFASLIAPPDPSRPVTTSTLDSGGRPAVVRSRIADAHDKKTVEGVGMSQFTYRVVPQPDPVENTPVSRFEAIALSPRCTLKATRSDSRGLIRSIIENQADILTTRLEPPGGQSAGPAYKRNYSDTLGFCKPIEKVAATWPKAAKDAKAAKVAYEYDPLQQLKLVNYPLEGTARASITVGYDLHGRMTEMRDPDSGCSRYAFDGLHNLTSKTTFGFEPDQDKACGQSTKVANTKNYEYAADRLMKMSYSSLQQQGGEDDQRDTVRFFYDRYPHVTVDGELLEAIKLIPNDLANRRFINVTGKICENCISQVTMVTDRTGARSYAFNELGQPKKETRSIIGRLNRVVPSEGESESFVPEVAFYEQESSYTAFGDLTRQEFNESVPSNPSLQCAKEGPEKCIARFNLGTRYAPDGSVATLLFNGQPLVNSALDALKRPVVRWTHDGTMTGQFYDPFDLRLNQTATITAAHSEGVNVPVQIAGYQYDGGGNVLGYRNAAVEKEKYASEFGFAYDGANRLVKFMGMAKKADAGLSTAGSYTYDVGHRFKSRQLKIEGNPGSAFLRTWAYQYNNVPASSRPVHAPQAISFRVNDLASRTTRFNYDDLGRMTKAASGIETTAPGVLSNRALTWDAEGRLKQVRGGADNYWLQNAAQLREQYVYDFGGNRVLRIHRPDVPKEKWKDKLAPENTTIYLTPFYARNAAKRGTVQVSHGTFPLASLVPPRNENAEPVVTYLYSDLAVGSASASVMATGDITDAESTVIARREYSPYGFELTARWLASPEGARNPPLSVFHGKELDRVTGFSSFGARSYSRDLGVWLGPDPMQQVYLFGRPNGGVFSPRNNAGYSFAGLNPVRASDRDGKVLDTILDVGFIIYDLGVLASDEYKSGGANRKENLIALGADIAGAVVPFATGGGLAARGGIKITDDVAKAVVKKSKSAAKVDNLLKVSTAKPSQSAAPRGLKEQLHWKSVAKSPESGKPLRGLNNDPRFKRKDGFQKMEASHKLPDGKNITIHYQYNVKTKKIYDMKITTPKRMP